MSPVSLKNKLLMGMIDTLQNGRIIAGIATKGEQSDEGN